MQKRLFYTLNYDKICCSLVNQHNTIVVLMNQSCVNKQSQNGLIDPHA